MHHIKNDCDEFKDGLLLIDNPRRQVEEITEQTERSV
jgi:hypothetical protein